MVDLVPLYSNNIDKISLDGKYDIPESYFANSKIHGLSDVLVKNGSIKKVEDDYNLSMEVSGKMLISDSISSKDVWYPFNLEINEKLDEFMEKDKNSLDIIEVLWQNIVLEVPLRYTVVKDYSDYQGDGWKLVSEEDLDNNNPFNTLLKDEDWSD